VPSRFFALARLSSAGGSKDARNGVETLPQSRIARAGEPIVSLESYRDGPLNQFLAGQSLFDLTRSPDALPAEGSQAIMFAPYLLQDIGDYRGALQRWFACIRVGGVLVVTVPHAFLYERQDAAPSRRRPNQRRLYSPRALIEEIEEALAPNTYRLRWLGDLDQGHDYASDWPTGRHDVAAVIERIAPPVWGLTEIFPVRPAPIDLFERDHVRVEAPALISKQRILALKLDHLGDFVMGIPALERLRSAFPDAEITLVVASWNEGLARELGVADHLIIFDAFPRHSGEEPVDVPGKVALFDAVVTEKYDLVIDLRTDQDTRLLLRNVNASVKAGIGLKSQFPFLDIFLPLDAHIGHFDTAWNERMDPDRFWSQDYCVRSPFSITCPGERIHQGGAAIIWGPYRALPPGDYVFEPLLEIDPRRPGLLACDIALDTKRIAYTAHADEDALPIAFSNERDGASFEFRLFAVADEPVPDFRFYGGRLTKRGAASALHQSEYLILLVDLIALRAQQTGLFREVAV